MLKAGYCITLALLVISAHWPRSVGAEGLAGIPIRQSAPFALGEDLSSGREYKRSMRDNFQPWGLQIIRKQDGHPVRLGEFGLRFETRENFCGWEDDIWNDCRMGRARHELSTAIYGFDEWDREYWYAVSVYVPESYRVPRNVGNSLIQFAAAGKPNWMIKFRERTGIFLHRDFDFQRVPIIIAPLVRSNWHDFVIRIAHAMDDTGRFTLWHNGRQAYDHRGRTARDAPARRKPFFKFGIYNTGFRDGAPADEKGFRNGAGLPNLHLYFDEVRVANSCRELKLSELGYDCAEMID